MTEFELAGATMPAIDAQTLSQYQALTERVGVVPLTGRTLIEVTGADRAAFLNSFCTNDVKRLKAGEGCEAFVTSHQGKTLGHVLVLVRDNELLLESTPGQANALISHFERFVISERVEFHDRTSQWSECLVAGPEAEHVLAHELQVAPPTAMLANLPALIDDKNSLVVWRTPWVASPAWLVSGPSADVDQVVASLIAGGATLCGSDSLEAARVEAGWPWFGVDITDDNLPQEIDRDNQAISFKKGCYLGQETVARIDALGHVNRRLVGVKLAGTEVPAVGDKLRHGDKEVGHLTSVTWSPKLNAPLGLALVRRAHAAAGVQLQSPADDAETIRLPLAP